MGIDYYILDKKSNKSYELGRHFSPGAFMEQLPYCINDEYAFKYLFLVEMEKANFDEIKYCMCLSNEIWNF